MEKFSEFFNQTTVTLKNVVWYFIFYTALVIFWVQADAHINDHELHANKFTTDWENRIEKLEYDLKVLSQRSDKRYRRSDEEFKELFNLIRSFARISVDESTSRIGDKK